MQSLQQVLNKNEFQLLLGCHEYNQLKEAEILMTLLQGNPAALVIFGSQLADKTHQILEKTNIPTINVIGSLSVRLKLPSKQHFLKHHIN